MGPRVYLSPHLDDAVFSCGGLIARQVAGDEPVTVLTLCAGDPPTGPLSTFAQALHARWHGAGLPVAARRAEDRMACGRLGASVLHLDISDAVYRRGPDGAILYPDEAAIFGPLRAADLATLDRAAARLGEVCRSAVRLYCPAAVGGHVDHRLTRLAAEQLGLKLWYYQDLPYAARGGRVPADLPLPAGTEAVVMLADEEIQAWAAAVGEYRSQLSTFWPDAQAVYPELIGFHTRAGGLPLLAPT